MTFDDWWIDFRGFDDLYGKEGMRDCWNAALEEAAKKFEEAAKYLSDMDQDKDTTLWAAAEVRSLKMPNVEFSGAPQLHRGASAGTQGSASDVPEKGSPNE